MLRKMLALTTAVLSLLATGQAASAAPYDGPGLGVIGRGPTLLHPVTGAWVKTLTTRAIDRNEVFNPFTDSLVGIGNFVAPTGSSEAFPRDEMLVRRGSDLRLLSRSSTTPSLFLLASARTSDWLQGFCSNGSVGPLGDFDGNGFTDLVIIGDRGLCIFMNMRVSGGFLAPSILRAVAYGTRIGEWTLQSGDFVEAVGRFDSTLSPARDQLVVRDGMRRHLAILQLNPTTFDVTLRNIVREGVVIRQSLRHPSIPTWRLTAGDKVVGVMSCEGVFSRKCLLLRSAAGNRLGLVYAAERSNRVLPLRDWSIGASDLFIGTLTLTNLGRRSSFLVKDVRGLRIETPYSSATISDGSTDDVFASFPSGGETLRVDYGARLGEWVLDKYDQIGMIGPFEGGNKDGFVIRNSSGLATLGTNGTFPLAITSFAKYANGSALGDWSLKSRDFMTYAETNRPTTAGSRAGDLDGDGKADFLLQCGTVGSPC